MVTSVVLDKSFLDGAPTQAVRQLCDDYDVLISDELFYELLATRPESLKGCFAKLPERTNPVGLIPNVGSLLSYEIERDEACTPVARHRLPGTFQFNPKLRNGTYVFEDLIAQDLEAWKARTAEDTRSFIERWSVVHQFFPELNGIEWKTFPSAIRLARKEIATNRDLVRAIYRSLLTEMSPKDAPRPERISPEWAIFRWVQCQILCALRLFEKYQGKVPDPQGRQFLENAEHSMLDCYHVIHGALVGAIATYDGEIREDLLLVQPTCTLIPTASKPLKGEVLKACRDTQSTSILVAMIVHQRLINVHGPCSVAHHTRARESLSALPTTDTELSDIAAAASMGESRMPNTG
jgi:hypothetical protein